MHTQKPILLVEDDQIDQKTIKRALEEIRVSNKLLIVNNGEEALTFLRNNDNPKPGIILLDLNMPRMNGIELLHILKQDNLLMQIPVVVLTTSEEERDKTESFKLSVAGYMAKPIDYVKFVDVMRSINQYWTLSEFPKD